MRLDIIIGVGDTQHRVAWVDVEAGTWASDISAALHATADYFESLPPDLGQQVSPDGV